MFVIFSCLHHTLYPLLSPKCPVLYHGVQLEDLVALLQRISRGTRSQVVPALVGNCRGQCPEDRGNFRARVLVLQRGISLVGDHLSYNTHLLRTAKVLRQLLNDKTIRQVLGQFSTDSDQDLSSDWGCTDELTVVAARSTSVGHPGQSRERWTNEHLRSARA
jgi:hypothetical protein